MARFLKVHPDTNVAYNLDGSRNESYSRNLVHRLFRQRARLKPISVS